MPAPDLLEGLAQQKKNQIVVGFCAETEDPLSEAKRKLKKKEPGYDGGQSDRKRERVVLKYQRTRPGL